MAINYYNDRVCLNVLGGSLDNARDIYAAAEGHGQERVDELVLQAFPYRLVTLLVDSSTLDDL